MKVKSRFKSINSYVMNEEWYEQLIFDYSSFVKMIALAVARKLPQNVDYDDLVSAGFLGLIDAIGKYDPGRENGFKTYAEWRIRGAIMDEVRKNDPLSRSQRDKGKKYDQVKRNLEQKNMGRVTQNEIASALGQDVTDLWQLTSRIFSDIHERGPELQESNEDGSVNPHGEMEAKEEGRILKDCLSQLSERERMVVTLSYYENMTLKEIAGLLNVSESRVCQIHKGSLLALSRLMKRKEFGT